MPELREIVIWAVIGLLAGWVASLVIKTERFNWVGYMLSGLAGSFIGGWIFREMEWTDDVAELVGTKFMLNQVLISIVGAILVLWVYNLVQRRR